MSERKSGFLLTDRGRERVEVLQKGDDVMERYTILAAMGYDPRPVWVIPADEEGEPGMPDPKTVDREDCWKEVST